MPNKALKHWTQQAAPLSLALGFQCRRALKTLIFSAQLKKRRAQMGRSSNDDRSDSMNPNNDAYDDSMDNRSNQLNPNNEEYQGNDDED